MSPNNYEGSDCRYTDSAAGSRHVTFTMMQQRWACDKHDSWPSYALLLLFSGTQVAQVQLGSPHISQAWIAHDPCILQLALKFSSHIRAAGTCAASCLVTSSCCLVSSCLLTCRAVTTTDNRFSAETEKILNRSKIREPNPCNSFLEIVKNVSDRMYCTIWPTYLMQLVNAFGCVTSG